VEAKHDSFKLRRFGEFRKDFCIFIVVIAPQWNCRGSVTL